MFKILKASKDTYITDRIVNNNFRATDANVGQAATLDLYKLYDESTISGSTTPTEISRALIKFDLDPIRALTGSLIDISHSSFKCTLMMNDINGGQTVPTNFRLSLFPLSQAFDEGLGRDVVSFADIDSCNFITASMTSDTVTTWIISGANSMGLLGSTNLDIISSGNLSDGLGVVNLWKEQLFSDGTEDLSIDITTIVSATLKGLLPDHGFRLSFSGTHETDTQSRFVKRFASRHTSNKKLVPRILVKFNDSVHDNHNDFVFDTTGTLFLQNSIRGSLTNLISGTTLLTTASTITLTLVSGTFSSSFNANQHHFGAMYISGVYSSTFALASNNSLLKNEIISAGSATFSEIWGSSDGTVGFFTGTFIAKSNSKTAFSHARHNQTVTISNMKVEYGSTDIVRFRVHVVDNDETPTLTRTVFDRPSNIYQRMHYRIRDAHSADIIVPFDETYMSTHMSTDSDGMYFDVHMDSLTTGYVYTFDILIRDISDQLYTNIGRFRVTQFS